MHVLQAFGMLYLSVIVGVMNLKVCELTKELGTPSVTAMAPSEFATLLRGGQYA
jgi:hypothetical protein